MRRLLVLALLLAVAAAFFVLARRVQENRNCEMPLPPGWTTEPGHAGAELEAPPADPLPTSAPSETAFVLGRVVDEGGKPLADARVWVFALDGKWKEGVLPPAMRVRGGEVRAFATQSGADGQFSITAPAPTGRRLRLEAETADHRGHYLRDLGRKLAPGQLPLVAGPNDLGTLVVPVRGAITGVVRARDGGGLAGAGIVLQSTTKNGFETSCSSDPDGSFALACVPDGDYRLSAELPGWLRDERGLSLGHSVVAAGVELTLVLIPILSGVVVDEADVPLMGKAVSAREIDNGTKQESCAHAISRSDGSFTVELDQEVPHSLILEGGAFATWESGTSYAPGTSGIRIVLRRLPQVTVVICDAITREPIERCGVWNYSGGDESPPEPETEPHLPPLERWERGEVPVLVTSPSQHVIAWALRHAPRVQRLTGELRQVIYLDRQGGLRGSLVRDGSPFSRARILVRSLDHVQMQDCFRGSYDSRGSEGMAAAPRANVDPEDRLEHANAQGEFVVNDLDAGRYELFAVEDGQGIPRRILAEVTLRTDETADVGTLEVDENRARLRLRFVYDSDATLRELKRLMRAELEGANVPLFRDRPSEPGSYELRGLAPGTFVLRIGGYPSGVPVLRSHVAELTEDRDHELSVDLRGLELSELCVRVEAPKSVRFLRIRVDAANPGTADQHTNIHWLRGELENARCTLLGGSRVVLTAYSESGTRLKTTPEIQLPARGRFETTLVVP